MKRVAVVGMGFMGRTHYGVWRKLRGAKVVAVCDSNLARLTAKVEGNAGNADATLDLKGVGVFADFDEMLAKGGIDIVDITLPTFLHPVMVKKALAAGCDVLCEKPMALSAKVCDEMLAAAKRHRRRLMIGQCTRFSDIHVYMKKLIDTGKYGKVTALWLSHVSKTPGWAVGGGGWFLDEKRSGGVALDLHIHDTDLLNYWFGKPRGVTSREHRRPDGVIYHITTVYDYPNMVAASEGNWGAAQSFVFEENFKVIFEKAVAVFDAKRAHAFSVFPEKGKPFFPKLTDETCYLNEIRHFLAMTEGRAKPLFEPFEARESVRIVDAERKSARTGRPVRIV